MSHAATLRPHVLERAAGRCEMVNEYGIRCRNAATDLHHRLPKGFGGRILDRVAVDGHRQGRLEAFHLEHLTMLCEVCHHEVAHGQPQRAVDLGLRVLGEVRHERWSGVTSYHGPDARMAALWPREDVA